MGASAADIARVRRMAAETSPASALTDDDVAEAIERHPVEDARGEGPWVESTTTPGTLDVNPDWTETYDLHHAAADLWGEKASAAAEKYDFSADGGQYSRSQVYQHCMQMVRFHLARRNPNTITQRPEPVSLGMEDREEFQ